LFQCACRLTKIVNCLSMSRAICRHLRVTLSQRFSILAVECDFMDCYAAYWCQWSWSPMLAVYAVNGLACALLPRCEDSGRHRLLFVGGTCCATLKKWAILGHATRPWRRCNAYTGIPAIDLTYAAEVRPPSYKGHDHGQGELVRRQDEPRSDRVWRIRKGPGRSGIKVLLYSTDSLCDFTSNNGTLSLIPLRQEPQLA
jgi:hypothetical protein